MKKLYTMFVAMILAVIMTVTSFAGTLQTYGTYRPYGAVCQKTTYGDKWSFINEYDNLISVSYIDSDYIMIAKNGESIIFYRDDPINHPNVYTCYARDGVTPMFWIKLTDSNPSTFTYVINTPWDGGMTFVSYTIM